MSKNNKAFSKPNKRAHVSALVLANVIAMAGAADAADTTSGETEAKPVKTEKTGSVTDAEGQTLDEVVVTATPDSYQAQNSGNGKYTEPLRDTPQTITVIPKALIQDQNATSLREVLQNVPGVTFGAGEGGTLAGDNITIRGYNARQDIFVDGFRDTGVYNRDPFNLEQVEVVKGPASAYSGHGSTGGSVNLITKAPTLTPSYEANIGFGTDQYYRDTVDINQPLTELIPNAALRFNGLYQYNQYSERDYIYDSRWGANPSLAFGLGTDTVLTLSYFYLQEQNLPSYGLPVVNATAVASNPNLGSDLNHVAPVPYSNFYGFVNRDYENTTTHIPTVKVEHHFDDDIKVENTTRYENTLRESVLTPPRFIALPAGMMNREMRARHQTDTLIGNQTEATTGFETWKIPHTLVTTMEFSREGQEYRTANGVNSVTPLYDPHPFDPYPYPIAWGAETKAHLDDIAFSLFDTIKLSPQWLLSGGVRYDHLESSSETDGAAATSFGRTDDLVSWRAALTYKPVEYGSIYFGYGTSYNPQIEGGSNSASADGLAANTVNLSPEENRTYELGTKWDVIDQKLSLSVALFRTEKNNARVTDPTAPAGTTVYALSGKQRVQGIEFGAAGNLTKEWKVFGGYTLMESRIMSGPPSSYPGNDLPNTPNQSASLWTTYDLPYHLTLGTGAQFIDKRYGSAANTTVADGYVTQQLMLAYRINKNFSVQVNVNNLWNAEYIQSVGSNSIPGSGRTVVVSADIKF